MICFLMLAVDRSEKKNVTTEMIISGLTHLCLAVLDVWCVCGAPIQEAV